MKLLVALLAGLASFTAAVFNAPPTARPSSTSAQQWSNAASESQSFPAKHHAGDFTVARFGNVHEEEFYWSYMFLKYKDRNHESCDTRGFGEPLKGKSKKCQVKAGFRELFPQFKTMMKAITSSDGDGRWRGKTGDLPDEKWYVLRKGRNGRYTYNWVLGWVQCHDDVFGNTPDDRNTCAIWDDPIEEISAPGFANDPINTPTGQWVECAQEGQDCVLGHLNGGPTLVKAGGRRRDNRDDWAFHSMLFEGPKVRCRQSDMGKWDPTNGGDYRCYYFVPNTYHYNPVGFWRAAVTGPANSDLSYHITKGSSSSRTQSETETFEYGLSISNTVGASAAFVSASQTITASFSHSIAQSVSNSATVSFGEQCAISSCSPGNGWKTIVMWSFEMDVGERCSFGDPLCNVAIHTCDFWCTSGYNTVPKCPPGACDDAECQTCLSGVFE